VKCDCEGTLKCTACGGSGQDDYGLCFSCLGTGACWCTGKPGAAAGYGPPEPTRDATDAPAAPDGQGGDGTRETGEERP
jgi:hypothetical protein